MNYLDDDLKINKINIPGTQDSGTYNIGKSRTLNNTLTYYDITEIITSLYPLSSLPLGMEIIKNFK